MSTPGDEMQRWHDCQPPLTRESLVAALAAAWANRNVPEHVRAALTFEPVDAVMGDAAAVEIARQGVDPQYEAFMADHQ